MNALPVPAKTKFTVALANGAVATRTSAKAYTHAVVGLYDDGTENVWAWSSSALLAEKRAKSLRAKFSAGVFREWEGLTGWRVAEVTS